MKNFKTMQATQCSHFELSKEYNAYSQAIENDLVKKRQKNPKEAILKEKYILESAVDSLNHIQHDPNKTHSGLIMAQIQLLKAQRQLIKTHEDLIKAQGDIIRIQDDLSTIQKRQNSF